MMFHPNRSRPHTTTSAQPAGPYRDIPAGGGLDDGGHRPRRGPVTQMTGIEHFPSALSPFGTPEEPPDTPPPVGAIGTATRTTPSRRTTR
jgi:hypothetical protein